MKLVVFRPEGAQDLAQGKAYSPPPWDSCLPNVQPPCKGKRNPELSCPFRAANFSLAPCPRALPWARSCALSGRTFGKSSNFMLHSLFLPFFAFFLQNAHFAIATFPIICDTPPGRASFALTQDAKGVNGLPKKTLPKPSRGKISADSPKKQGRKTSRMV